MCVCCNVLGETLSNCLVQFVSDGVSMQEEKLDGAVDLKL